MKKISDSIFAIGFSGFVFGICGCDSSPEFGFVTGIIGISIAWTGYQMGIKNSTLNTLASTVLSWMKYKSISVFNSNRK